MKRSTLKDNFNSRSGLYSMSNVTFDPETTQAYSFKWWLFTDVINGKVVFNKHCYSSFTSRHQGKVRSLMRELGIKIDIEVDAHNGLQRDGWKEEAINSLTYRINELKSILANSRRKKALDVDRVTRLNDLELERQNVTEFINSIKE